jgi:osmotically-inducible protein OsmY
MKTTSLPLSVVRMATLGVVLATALSACAPVVVGGAMVGSALMASDRRTAGAQVEDEGLEVKAAARVRELLSDQAHVNVTSYNRVVLITGEVPRAEDKATIEQAIRRLEGVNSIVNDLAVMPASGLKDRSADTILSARVKASFIDAKDLISTAFKVTTERGVVYLMGRVTEREANRASEVARGVSGVAKVVRVFDILTEDQLANLPNAIGKGDSVKK